MLFSGTDSHNAGLGYVALTIWIRWVLSSVVLYVISTVYAQINSRLEEDVAHAARVSKLVTEIDVRLVNAALDSIAVRDGPASSSLLAPSKGTYREFDGIGMISLAVILNRMCGYRVPETEDFYGAMVGLTEAANGQTGKLVEAAIKHIDEGRNLVGWINEACLRN